jgi:hypothetical protein
MILKISRKKIIEGYKEEIFLNADLIQLKINIILFKIKQIIYYKIL